MFVVFGFIQKIEKIRYRCCVRGKHSWRFKIVGIYFFLWNIYEIDFCGILGEIEKIIDFLG